MTINSFSHSGGCVKRYGGGALMIAGVALLAFIALPPSCLLFAAGIALLIAGYRYRNLAN